MDEIRVECYSGHRADERPVRFFAGEHKYEVQSVEDKWYSPDATYFRVIADDGNMYVLRHDETKDVWTMEAFARDGRRAVTFDKTCCAKSRPSIGTTRFEYGQLAGKNLFRGYASEPFAEMAKRLRRIDRSAEIARRAAALHKG